MPCATIHLHLADRILAHWEEHPDRAPFPAGDPVLREAFLHGSMAPDMGFVPGVDRFVSELAHYLAPAELARNIFRRARTPREEAFAWGWAGHVLGDVVLHPMVGRAVGERLHGDRSRRMNAVDDLPTHVGMEVGLDLALLDRVRMVSPPPGTPFFRGRDVGLLTEALAATYGIGWSSHSALLDHRRSVQLTALWPRALALLRRAGWPERTPQGLSGLLISVFQRSGRRLAGSETALRGFLRPLRPPDWLVAELVTFAEELPGRMDELARAGPDALEDRNLETGEPAGAHRGHPPSDQVLETLRRRRTLSSGPPSPGNPNADRIF